MSKRYIGISGVARAGKNLFCDISKKIITEHYGLKCNSYALASYLKGDCKEFIKDKLGLDVFTENTDEKKIFRDMLVWYGDVKRKQSNGRYWTEKLQADMEKDDSDVIFVTDIRYDFYPKDEVYWIKNDLKGHLIHVSKYTYGFPPDGRRIRSDVANTQQKIWVEPANDHERWNDPKVKASSDYALSWPHIKSDGKTYEDIVNDESLNEMVRPIYKLIFNK
jgi:hypothetical protein